LEFVRQISLTYLDEMFIDSVLDDAVVNDIPAFFRAKESFTASTASDSEKWLITISRITKNFDLIFFTEFHGDFLFLMSYSTKKYRLTTTMNAQNTLAKGLSVSKPFANARKIAQM
jgi:hypothetical protein